MKTKFKEIIKILVLCSLILIGIPMALSAQKDTTKTDSVPAWWFGATIGGNVNFYHGSTQSINPELLSYPAFHDGMGIGLYVAPTMVYHKSNTLLGIMLESGYDSRKGKFEQVTTPCNCPADLKTNLSYLTIEPSLRVAPFKGKFYLYGGPRFAFNIGDKFEYDKGASADGTILADPKLKGSFNNMNKSVISMHIGAGYDIILSSKKTINKVKQVMLSPYVDFHPYFGQNPRSIETWNLTTVRVGIALKFGHKNIKQKSVPVIEEPVVPVIIPVPVIEEPVVVLVPVEINKYVIFFDFDKYNLNKQSVTTLNKLINELNKDTTMTVEITSYADLRGSEKYNIILSEKRSNSVLSHLKVNGIKDTQIKSKGLGETSVFNKVKGNVSELEYSLNRRSNVVVINIIEKK